MSIQESSFRYKNQHIRLVEKDQKLCFCPLTSKDKISKKKEIAVVMEQIVSIALQHQSSAPKGKMLESYYFAPKLNGSRIQLRLECYSNEQVLDERISFSSPFCKYLLQNDTEGCSHLQINEQKYNVSGDGTLKIVELILEKNMLVKGKHFEHIDFHPRFHEKIEFWNNWKKIVNLSGENSMAEKYRMEIYPFCMAFLENTLPQDAVILEVCGGDGEVANMVFKHFGNKIKTYHLLELNPLAAFDAEKILGLQIKEKRTYVHPVDVTQTHFLTLTKGEKVDVVFGTGAYTRQVLKSREAALLALKETAKALKIGGKLFLSGLEKHWVSSEDLVLFGFEVENTHSPCNSYQIYCATKKYDSIAASTSQ